MTIVKPFDEVHQSLTAELVRRQVEVADSPAVEAQKNADTVTGLMALAEGYSRQLRYREAVKCYEKALALEPDNYRAKRLLAGRCLTMLQCERAKEMFLSCLSDGGEEIDCRYRYGLACYFSGALNEAMRAFGRVYVKADDEMGIAAMYWYTIAAIRIGAEPIPLYGYRKGMKVGHHTAYEEAMHAYAAEGYASVLYDRVKSEPDDLEAVIILYGLMHCPELKEKKNEILQELLHRDGFWPAFSYLAAAIESGIVKTY